jgi:alpha-tubulin suppressor-like RCC1 family protein
VGWYGEIGVHINFGPLTHGMFAGNGGLGHGDSVSQPKPALVEALANDKIKIKQIEVGNGHMYALSNDGVVYSWGNGEYGRCGNGKKEQLLPQPIELLQDKRVVAIASGQLHGLALTDKGDIWAWGKNDAGQLGVGGAILMDLNTMEEFPLLVELEGDDSSRFGEQTA